jgi:hypothetical protein
MIENEQNSQTGEEPTVLDYVLAKLMPWRGPAPEIPAEGPQAPADPPSSAVKKAEPAVASPAVPLPWRTLGSLALALLGQLALAPPVRQGLLGGFFFLLAAAGVLWAYADRELEPAALDPESEAADDFMVDIRPLGAGFALLAGAFFAFSRNPAGDFLYTDLNMLLWLAGVGLVVWSLWKPRPDLAGGIRRAAAFFRREGWSVSISRHAVLLAAALALGVFFKVYRLGEVVPEMFSDHAEKLLDVVDVLEGQTRVFFPRNTGREGLQFYLIAWTIQLFDTGISFLSMKIGTVLFGIAMLPYIYLLGREVGNKQVGLLAVFFAGVSIWPNLLARVALRFILYPALAAPVFYYLVRGLKTGKRHYFILTGLFLGIGLHGYSPFRVVPVMVVLVMLLYWLQRRSTIRFYKAFVWLGIVALVSLAVFVPLMRVWTQAPLDFNQRVLSRMTAIEAGDEMARGWALAGVFVKNVWDGLLMLNWDSGDTWVNTLPGYPSLDATTGAAFVLGVCLAFGRLIAERRWEDGMLLLGIPVLMLPSTLALAFPAENPAPNRAGGAMIFVFILAAMAVEAVLRSVRQTAGEKHGGRLTNLAAAVLVVTALGQNYHRTFELFPQQYLPTAKNTSELGAVIRQFTDTGGSEEQAWVVAYPHWVDTRLVGINAGFPTMDFAIWPDEIESTLVIDPPKLFLLNLADTDGLEVLQQLYPDGRLSIYEARISTQSFMIYYIP